MDLSETIRLIVAVAALLIVVPATVMVLARRRTDHIVDLIGHINECEADCRACGRLMLRPARQGAPWETYRAEDYYGSEDDAYQAAYAHIRRRYGQIFNHLDREVD